MSGSLVRKNFSAWDKDKILTICMLIRCMNCCSYKRVHENFLFRIHDTRQVTKHCIVLSCLIFPYKYSTSTHLSIYSVC